MLVLIYRSWYTKVKRAWWEVKTLIIETFLTIRLMVRKDPGNISLGLDCERLRSTHGSRKVRATRFSE